ncbi:MAG: DUF1987 domain-containing protein [Bacteroidales bacterium]|nr:DUF1987 domain-containing protein [Bacteroidales bacterium]HPD94353.1 DUF1987 domain-containing protein [Tenuifilaceae bacterium]HRX30868.1 DUF1987 domain-containing protein [Tenuifilaceae bacterium]
MNPLHIKGTSQYPTITLDKESKMFFFSGNSLPEDAKAFYEPVLAWIDEYSKAPNPETVIRFRMVYYNTPSSKLLFQILKRFEKLTLLGSNVSVIWEYNEDDIDIKDAGRDLAQSIKVPFKLESYKE